MASTPEQIVAEIQELYLKNLVLNSKRGYFIYNHIHENPEDLGTIISGIEAQLNGLF